MAYDLSERCISLVASDDLSGNQFELVKLDGAGKVALVAGVDEQAIGVLTNKPDADGKVARVCVGGVTRVKAEDAVAIGAKIGNGGTANSKTLAALTTNPVYGTALEAASAADEVISCLVNFESPTELQ